nr:capsid protein [Porcine parvovirus 7]
MAEHITLSNTFMAYWENDPYQYPSYTPFQKNEVLSYSTGWHILPNILWRHFLSPKQWYELCINYEAYHVEGTSTTVFNPIPITNNLAIQGTNTFTAFNNTIYSLGTTDDLYETGYHNWYEDELWRSWYVAYKEGLVPKRNVPTKDGVGNSWNRLLLPIYRWSAPITAPETNWTWVWNTSKGTGAQNYPTAGTTWPHTDSGTEQVAAPAGCFWDPFTNPDSIQELRPGKNAMSFHWKTHGADEHCWYNLDSLVKLFPYTPESGYSHNIQNKKYKGPPGSRIVNENFQHPSPQTSFSSENLKVFIEHDVPNVLNAPIVPIQWFWIELERNLIEDKKIEKPQLGWPGTEWATPKYPPMNNFIKGIPLTDENGTLVKTVTMGCFRNSLHLSVKKRRSRMFAPTWGPMSVEMTHGIDSAFVLPTVRYRTGGARRSWQARTRDVRDQQQQQPWYQWNPYMTGTYTTTTTTSTYTTTTSQK